MKRTKPIRPIPWGEFHTTHVLHQLVCVDDAMNYVNLARLFNLGSFHGERLIENLYHLSPCLLERSITLTLIPIQNKGTTRVPLSYFSGRTNEHRELCSRGARWLELQGHHWRGEVAYPAGISDVTAPDAKIAIECGNTREKAFDGCRAGWSVLVIPYASASETVGATSERQIGFMFKPGPEPNTVEDRLYDGLQGLVNRLDEPD